ncbi:MAG: threonine/serine exporter family protein [Eubacteriales bacterium]|nr:threonine/serine exporter family protein [Eubacteriales bacterium]
MEQKRRKDILILAIRAGKIMMKSGAEIYRVEDTIERICKACGIEYVNVFATPTGIFVSIDSYGSDDTVTYIKRIRSSATDLSKISKVNQFSREFTTTDMTVEEGMKLLDEIEAKRPYPFAVRLLGAGVVTSCFSVIFGGTVIEFGVAFAVGMLCYTLSRFLEKLEINFFIKGFVCTALASFCALLAAASIEGALYVPAITGCIMLFVPGVAITNSIRDFLSGDMLSGLARMTEAALIGVSLAAGAGVVIKLWTMMGGITL